MTEISLQMLKHDGSCYRHHPAELVAHLPAGLVLLSRRGTTVWDRDKGPWQAKSDIYHYCWFDRWYNVLEVYNEAGQVEELYVHIASPVTIAGDVVRYIDYELDVTDFYGPPRLIDEDEFAEAALQYGYTPELQQHCYQAAAQAKDLVRCWQVGLPPAAALAQAPSLRPDQGQAPW